jgi:hypothetical protein
MSLYTVNMADMKILKGLAATGIGTVDCARHDMKLANGVGDLQKGERYAYCIQSASFVHSWHHTLDM